MSNDPGRPSLENFQFQSIGQKPSLLGRLENDLVERRQVRTPSPSPEPMEDPLPAAETPLRRPRLLEALSHPAPGKMTQHGLVNGTPPSGTVPIFDASWTRILQRNITHPTASGTSRQDIAPVPPALDFEAIWSLYSRLEALRSRAQEEARPFDDEDITTAAQAAKSEAARVKTLAGTAHTAAKKAVQAAQESLRLAKECLHSADALNERVDQSLATVTRSAEAGKSWNAQLKTLNDELLDLRTWIENQHRIDQDRSKLVDTLRHAVEERDRRLAQVPPPAPVASSSSSSATRPADAMAIDRPNSPSTPTQSDNEATAEIEALLKEQAMRKKRNEEEVRRRQQEERLLQEKSDRLAAELAQLEKARQEKLRAQEEETKRLEEEERELEKKKATILENARLKAQLRMPKDRQCSQSATLSKNLPPKPVEVASTTPLRIQPVSSAQAAIPTPLDSSIDRCQPGPLFPVPVQNSLPAKPATPPNSAVTGMASTLPSPPVPSPKSSLTTVPSVQRAGALQSHEHTSSTTIVHQQDTAVTDRPIKAESKEVVLVPVKQPPVKVKQEEDVPVREMPSLASAQRNEPSTGEEQRRQEPPVQPATPTEQPAAALNQPVASAPQAAIPDPTSIIPTGPALWRPHPTLPSKPPLPTRSYPRHDHPPGPPDPPHSSHAPDDRGDRGYPPRRYNPRLPSPNSRHYSPPRSPPPRSQYAPGRRRPDYYASAYNGRSRDTSNSNSASGDDDYSPAPGDHASAGRKRRREDDDPPGGPLNRRGRCDPPGPQRSHPQATWPEQSQTSGPESRRSPSPVHRDIPRQRQVEDHPPNPPADLPPRPRTPTGSLVGRVGDRQPAAAPLVQQQQHTEVPPGLPRPPPPQSPSSMRRSPSAYSNGQSGGIPARPLLDRFSDSAPKGYPLPGRNSTRGGRGRGSTRGRNSTSHQTNQHIPTLMDRIS